eukprot:TRINITY_DN61890_c0_g1_i2.p1 TRINITY_DN61890_c0_g1~~TRINITY_DN61890_c0_g1_i2.p1  ORF type:complete len:363 (+),score=19.78 TRINITY_DN61890_c0_g1_i2:182-1270(+)
MSSDGASNVTVMPSSAHSDHNVVDATMTETPLLTNSSAVGNFFQSPPKARGCTPFAVNRTVQYFTFWDDVDRVVATVRREGIVVLKNLFSVEMIHHLSVFVDRMVPQAGGHVNLFSHVPDPKMMRQIAWLAWYPPLQKYLIPLLGNNYNTIQLQMTRNPKVPWHWHYDYVPYSVADLVGPSEAFPAYKWMLYLQNHTVYPSLGVRQRTHLVVTKNNNRSEAKQAARSDMFHDVGVTLDVGDVIIHDIRLWHRVLCFPTKRLLYQGTHIRSGIPFNYVFQYKAREGPTAAWRGLLRELNWTTEGLDLSTEPKKAWANTWWDEEKAKELLNKPKEKKKKDTQQESDNKELNKGKRRSHHKKTKG